MTADSVVCELEGPARALLTAERNALNFLMPFVQPDLQLSNTQVGMFSSALSLTWALSGLAVGRISDKLGSRKPAIVVATAADVHPVASRDGEPPAA